MFVYEKKLQYPVKIDRPNPKLAAIIISQYGGPDGELGASLRYLSQRYSMPFDELKGLLTDIGTEGIKWNPDKEQIRRGFPADFALFHLCFTIVLENYDGFCDIEGDEADVDQGDFPLCNAVICMGNGRDRQTVSGIRGANCLNGHIILYIAADHFAFRIVMVNPDFMLDDFAAIWHSSHRLCLGFAGAVFDCLEHISAEAVVIREGFAFCDACRGPDFIEDDLTGGGDGNQNGKDQSAATFHFLVMEKTGLILFVQYHIPLLQKTQIDSVPTALTTDKCTSAESKGGFEPGICLKSKIGIIGKNDQRQG